MKRTSMLIALSLILVSLQSTGQANTVGKNANAVVATGIKGSKPMASPDSRDDDDSRGTRCSNRSVRGKYGIAFSGVVNGVGSVATLGVITLDGRGGFTIEDTASFNGIIVDRVGAGPYTVNADCTGNATVTYTVGQPGRQATFNVVVLEGGSEFLLISTTPGAIVSGKASRLSYR